MGARETALRVLMSCRNNHAWADAALKAQLGRDGLVGPEAALCSRLVYGVVQNQQLLDFYLSAYCSQKPDHLQPPLLEILRLGAYQILYLARVPDSAAVNTSVELAKLTGRGQASGLVNAVLRKIAQNKTALPPIPERDEAKYLSIRYSHPKWLVKRLLSILGREETEAFLAANNDTPPLTVQVNPLKTNAESLIGKQAIVTEEVDNLMAAGTVSVDGQEWTARNVMDGVKLPRGTIVIIRAISGVKLIVEERNEGM